MAGKEWFLTKVVGTALGLITIISICLGGAIFVVEVKQDISRVDGDVKTHRESDEKKWDKATKDIDGLKDDVHQLELIDRELALKYAEILRRFDEQNEQLKIVNMKLDNLVRAE